MLIVNRVPVNFEADPYDVYIPCKGISKNINLSLAYANGSIVVSKMYKKKCNWMQNYMRS